MSKPINYLIPGTTLNQTVLDSAANSAIQGYKESAIQKISQCGLSQKQMEKVTKIINETPSSNSSTRKLEDLLEALKERIIIGLKASICIFPDADKPIAGLSACISRNADKPISLVPDKDCFYKDYFFYMDKLPSDMVFEICKQCLLGGDCATVRALGTTSKIWYQNIINPSCEESIAHRFSFKEWGPKLCPRLKILNASGSKVDNQPFISIFSLVGAYQALDGYELYDDETGKLADILFFIIPKGLTIKSLLSMAKECGMDVSIGAMDQEAVQNLDSYDYPVGCPYAVLIVDGFCQRSCIFNDEDLGKLADQLECRLPALGELLAAHIFKYKTTGQYRSFTVWGCTGDLADGDPLHLRSGFA